MRPFRGPKLDSLTFAQATRAFVLANQADKKQRDHGREALVQLCTQNPPITDEETIHQLETALSRLRLEEQNAVQLWERAAIAKPTHKDLQERWIARAVAEKDWISAQKVSVPLPLHFMHSWV